MTNNPLITGIGEALYDLLPVGPVLGGAPLNAVFQANQIGLHLGGKAVMVSRIGEDELGKSLFKKIKEHGMDHTFIQQDPNADTGTVSITLNLTEPEYEITKNVAWDKLEWNESLSDLANRCNAVCFGTLGQRAEPAKSTIQKFIQTATQANRLFDVNLRQNYFSKDTLDTCFQFSSIVKMNEEELPIVSTILGLTKDKSPILQIIDHYNLDLFVLTQGKLGTRIYSNGMIVEGMPVQFIPEENADSVGAGDACSAAILHGTTRKWPLQKTANLANQLGAYVASRSGATPNLPPEILSEWQT